MTAAARRRSVATLSAAQEAALRKYFRRSDDLSAASSSTGAMLERQSSKYRDSEGRRIAPAESWVYMHLNEDHTKSEPSYTPEYGEFFGVAVLSRQLMGLSMIHHAALECFYGPIGMHWEQIFERSREIGAIYHLTETGQRLVAASNLVGHAPHRVIEDLLRGQEGTPTEERERDIRRMDEEARELLADAKGAFAKLA